MTTQTYQTTKRTYSKPYPCSGTLYHRKNGRYINADVPNAGPFYFRYKRPDGKDVALSLGTEDRREATKVANSIITALGKDIDYGSSMGIAKIWDTYEANALNTTDATLDDYKQIFRRFVKWTDSTKAPVDYRGLVKSADDVTTDLCRKYAIQVCAAKTTGMRDLYVLRSIWNLVFPFEDNPWNLNIKPKVKVRDPGDKSRMLTVDEARRLRAAILLEAEEWSSRDERKRSNVMTPELLADLYDAIVFAWWYGMRIGSFCNLEWRDFGHSPDWFLHVPPKTEKCRTDPLQLPIVPEIAEIINRRRKDATSEWVFPHLHAQYHKRGKVVERNNGYEIKRSANRTGQAEFCRDVKKLFQKAGIEETFKGRASLHGFRKSCANNLEASGASIYLIRSILGWAGDSAGIENRYIMDFDIERQRDTLMKAIPPLGNGEVEREMQMVMEFETIGA